MSDKLREAAQALLPCPFCGGDVMFTVEQRENHPDYGGHSAMCGTCGAGIGYVFACGDDPRPILMEQWNKRTALAEESDAYWLIERGSPAEYWVAGMPEEWTKDPRKAQRFTQWGAEHHAKELEQLGVNGPLRACEHMECAAAEKETKDE